MPLPDVDLVFKALADPTRRHLLDLLRERDGQTLGELCEGLEMTRQSATQHLGVLEAANLVSTRRVGRQKLHHLNPVPIHELQERWIATFDRPRLRAISTIKQRAERTMTLTDAPTGTQTFVYVTYIRATPDAVWDAITDPEVTAQYWAHRNESTWAVGDDWAHVRNDGTGTDVVGVVEVSDRPRTLAVTWGGPDGEVADRSRVTMDLDEQDDGIVRLTVTHEGLDPEWFQGISQGWPAVLSNLKSLLETGGVLPGLINP